MVAIVVLFIGVFGLFLEEAEHAACILPNKRRLTS